MESYGCLVRLSFVNDIFHKAEGIPSGGIIA